MVRTRYSQVAAASLLSPLPMPLHPRRITLCGHRALWRTCIHQLWGQGATLNPLIFRTRLNSWGFEELCCRPVGNRSSSGVRVGVSTRSHAYFMKLWYWASICAPTHVGCTGAAIFSLLRRIPDPCSRWHWLPKFNSDLTSLSDFVPEKPAFLRSFSSNGVSEPSTPWRALFMHAGVIRCTPSLDCAW